MIIKPEMITGRITKYDLLPLSFLKKSPYTGSKGSLRYKIEREVIPIEEESAEALAEPGVSVGEKTVKPVQEQIVLRVFCWRGPNAFDETPEDEKTVKDFDFSEEALGEIIDYLNLVREEQQ